MNVTRVTHFSTVNEKYFLRCFFKKSLFLLFICFSIIPPAMAQSNGNTSAGKAPDQIISEMKERLNLTEEQAVQFHPIMEESIEKRHALVQNYRGKGLRGMRSLRNEMQELREKTEKQLETILTATQMEEFRKMQDEQRKKMRDKIRSGGRL